MAGDDDFDDGGGGDLGVEGLDGNGDGGGGDARSDTGTSEAGKTLVKKRITLETDLQKWVTAGSDFIAPKEADGKSATEFRAWLTGASLGIPCMTFIDENIDETDFFDESKFDTYVPADGRDLILAELGRYLGRVAIEADFPFFSKIELTRPRRFFFPARQGLGDSFGANQA
jgi:hypothetical protein